MSTFGPITWGFQNEMNTQKIFFFNDYYYYYFFFQILKKVRFTSDFTKEDHVYCKSNDYDDYDYYDYDFDEDGEESIV